MSDTGALEGIDLSQLAKLITVQDVAEMFDVEPRIVRRAARKNEIPGTVKVLGKIGFDPDKVADWVPLEAGERRGRVTREDGRRRYRIYLSEDEFKALKDEHEIVDPRIASRARRDAKKAGVAGGSDNADSEDEGENPFEEFGA